jgi:tetratricopeptide (TPR) repeat protein
MAKFLSTTHPSGPKLAVQRKSLTLSEKRKELAENKKRRKAKKENLKGISPSETEINNLLQQYHSGRYGDAEKLAVSITQEFPTHQFAWKVLSSVLKQTGRVSESLVAGQKSVQLMPHDAEAQNNLGNTLEELGRLGEAEASYKQAIALKPDYAEAHSNLGATLKEFGRLDEAEASLRQSIALKPDLAEAQNNLGVTLQKMDKLEEAEVSYKQAIALKPDYAEAHSNLGNTLEELGRKDEAEANYRQAIVLNPDYAKAHYNLGKVLYIKGYKDLALESIEKANNIDSQSKEFQLLKEIRLLLSVMKSRKSREGSEAALSDTSNTGALTGLTSSPLILNRAVETELIANIYEMSFIEMNKTKKYGLLPAGKDDARYGNGICSPDFNLFKDSRSIIQKLAEDLTRTMMEAVKSDIYIFDSFFNILRAGGGSTPHIHLNKLDKNIGLNIGKQKYSLVYYLAAGDQSCSEPGILKLYDPVQDILPCDGMITIIPASRLHSAVYSGKTDRVMIGINFYSL